MIQRIVIIGTGLIGASTGLALRAAKFTGTIAGFDASGTELAAALENGAIDTVLHSRAETITACESASVVILAVPVLAILDWMHLLAPVLKPGQLITDVGSTKLQITDAATRLFAGVQAATFLPGHPMAGKESGGAALAEATLFHNAMWLCTPPTEREPSAIEQEWRSWIAKFGARTLDLEAAHHDELCAWVSHLPQMLSTALAALLEDTFGNDPARRAEIDAIGGRALREMTRLGASPYSMWRDVALSNTDPVAATLLALEQRLQHIRENLKTPELREEFLLANKFRERR
ncbi:prephenate dehydrogenase [Granulicella aggregans]|uniref:Prephenate dehydrogenase n=1 Tax=Granulicella aggregans TaxID=474949 RepID=A0A7W7ZEA8_9BACT|nr:prephenate dehydrogenase/arogenate dehydrogenase family protein [Granulicella aggregans]MBB5058330.1 prephenate dehydrogenase [Granulicella aggregans]